MKKIHVLSFFVLFSLFAIFPTEAAAERTVVLDPGHGGIYSGTTGYSGASTGYYEKHFNLETAKKMKAALEAEGYDVHMTREGDTQFSSVLRTDLKMRSDNGNDYVKGNNDNAIFLSIHSNALPSNPYMRGYETYYFDMDTISSTYPPDPMQIEYAPESKRLTNAVHKNILAGTPLKEGRGKVPGNLYVTRNAQMPSALLEFGYMSNPEEEKLIQTASFQNQAAAAVVKAADEFFQVYEVRTHDDELLKRTEDKSEALDYAESKDNVYVFDKYAQERIYNNINKRYGVYHSSNSSATELFLDRDEAIAHAKKWKNMRVVDNKEGRVIWSNYLDKSYKVVHSNQGTLFEAYTEDEAVAYAKKWKNTSVINEKNDKVVWTNYLKEIYDVTHTEKGSLASFYREDEAVAYAKHWKNTKVTNTQSGDVVWDNIESGYSYAFDTKKLSGKDRMKTAVEVSKELYPNGFQSGSRTVVLATAFEFADALSAGPLAAKYDNAPILLNRTESLSTEVSQELARLKADKVLLLGGENALSKKVEDQLKKNYAVERISGKTRIESNIAINKHLTNAEGVFVASSTSFPDALEASAIAAANGWSIILTDKEEIGDESLAYLAGKEVAILGGTAVVSEEVEKSIINNNGADRVVRLSGATRYGTVVEAIRHFEDELHADTVLTATGTNYPDALTASSLSAKTSAPLILVGKDLDPDMKELLQTYGRENVVDRLDVIGGVVTDQLRNEIAGYLK
ncbi:cell wall-binding repeat-containing protein [Halobacillus sp. ACCC02827]|uniref:cell wall-binding repeat-containing protein n=1 Tax=Halobacillus sp. ACCC02827 TaxID=3052090 RepID=UPI002570C86F|nr:cell wall-binding repeat-containing protein [Halobacillus sp. ACCC02827]WJE15288.1 cell wall-binding repeat-containing protein [Halobacillus sp. ACCC02827]